MYRKSPASKFDALYLAVLPFYREYCIQELKADLSLDVILFAGDRHVDPTIRTGISRSLYVQVRNYVLAGRVLVQLGGWRTAISAKTTILDLNPRSLTAWTLLGLRRILGRRTLLWGHLHPRSGRGSRTAVLRRSMRRLSNGTVLYGYDSVPFALAELPGSPVWVAPNSLYARDALTVPANEGPYTSVLYVGRLVSDKKVDLLIRGFLRSDLATRGVQLVIVGEGAERKALADLVSELGGNASVTFLGQVADVNDLRHLYEDALCSVSPGYVGLSLTQSLGFGVPMLISRDEPHSPELELARIGGVEFFETDSPLALAAALDALAPAGNACERQRISIAIRKTYSAEAMAAGIASALKNTKQELGDDGWPSNR